MHEASARDEQLPVTFWELPEMTRVGREPLPSRASAAAIGSSSVSPYLPGYSICCPLLSWIWRADLFKMLQLLEQKANNKVVLELLILTDRILIYSFGMGQGLTTGTSHWFGLRALGKPYLHVGGLGAAPM